ncbi:MAG: 2-C-methyl-D-erythritol 4-phosphate cytidylyltransferase [Clostridia bacterium]|nr:2-C-methyl-D-erythritol 4-phosphate cytidylyltransferase [Clostridia bacterium]
MSLFNKNNIPCPEPPFVSAIVAAAGNSTRMNGVNKQLLLIDGVPVLIRSLKALAANEYVREIVVSAREEDIPEFYKAAKEFGVEKLSAIVRGADTRQQSVLNAVHAVSEQSEYLLIHDGARPLVTNKIINEAVITAFKTGAAAAGVRVKDTVKVVGGDESILSTPERDTLRAVQTPQVFSKKLYLDALESVADAESFTDDCKLIEAYGGTVTVTEGSYENIKITTPEDLVIAQALIKTRNEV